MHPKVRRPAAGGGGTFGISRHWQPVDSPEAKHSAPARQGWPRDLAPVAPDLLREHLIRIGWLLPNGARHCAEIIDLAAMRERRGRACR